MSGHVVPLRVYYLVFGGLMGLTALTTGVAFLDLGAMNAPIALTIAVGKALIVALYFMHLRWSSRLIWVVAVAGVFWLLILFVLTLGDFHTRGMVPGWAGG